MTEEQERRQLIEEINKIRKNFGMEEYSKEQLNSLSTSELEQVYYKHKYLTEKPKSQSEPKSKSLNLNLKLDKRTIIIIAAIIIVLISVSILIIIISTPSSTVYNQSTSNGQPEAESAFKAYIGFTYSTEDYTVFSLKNSGTESITDFTLKIDSVSETYEIKEGELPLQSKETLYFKTKFLCDDKKHQIEVNIGDLKLKTLVLPDLCFENILNITE